MSKQDSCARVDHCIRRRFAEQHCTSTLRIGNNIVRLGGVIIYLQKTRFRTPFGIICISHEPPVHASIEKDAFILLKEHFVAEWLFLELLVELTPTLRLPRSVKLNHTLSIDNISYSYRVFTILSIVRTIMAMISPYIWM